MRAGNGEACPLKYALHFLLALSPRLSGAQGRLKSFKSCGRQNCPQNRTNTHSAALGAVLGVESLVPCFYCERSR